MRRFFTSDLRLQNISIGQEPDSGCTYAEVKVKCQDTNAAASYKSSGKSCCSRKRVAVCVVTILVLVLAVYLIITYVPTVGSLNSSKTRPSTSQNDSTLWYTTSQPDSTILSSTSQQDSTSLSPISQKVSTPLTPTNHQNSTLLSPTIQEISTKSPPSQGGAPGCPSPWKKHGRKCYFFSTQQRKKDWNYSRAECAALYSDLVIIESREELNYLHTQSEGSYYLLGLTYSPEEQKWKWINNVEYNPAIFSIYGPVIHGPDSHYHCTVIGFGNVSTAPCHGTESTQNMCEKAATI